MSAIQISAVRKQFGKQEILKSIDLEIRDKEFTVLLGPSGCGKSTLLRIIAGLEYESSGSIRIGEREITSLAPRDRRIAMVFQNYAVFPHMTVAENIAFGLRVRKDSEAHIQRKVKETAALMHIEDRLDHYSGQLSGGQRQRVAVARALAMEPEVLLMDEPLSNLDALLRLEMRAELKTILAASDTTTIYVTHDQVEAMSLADRIAVMKGGQIEQYAPPSEIYHYPATEFVGSFIGNPPMNFIPPDARWNHPTRSEQSSQQVHKCGIRPEDFEVRFEPTENFAPVRVLVSELLGSHKQLTARFGDEMIRVNVPSDLDVGNGSDIHIRPLAEKVRFYDHSGHLMSA
ncbi:MULTISPECIES: ABC transporter ATP-binding protein [Cobetia]|uniref:ABC transporter ATP-binding protein n=1 Tax=Cobetia TaxID=204286 RepID=UPI0006CA4FF8|nr:MULTISPECIES: ABC transporter ATP-binding protein [unclassified Cobetia]KPM75941.1 sugar ABC transporter ATP-binding protein [Cobetia sp. UCD-24C]MCK8067173.1 ABC transporter ATP-binding protein [Cobetia sp. 1CM21F]